MINYNNLIREDFYNSKFYIKNKDILLISYLHEKDKSYLDYKILLSELLSYENFSETDKAIILDDWDKIKDKVQSGLAHQISEGDTMYLGAVTKSATSKNRRSQPNGPDAKPRAFSYKNGFMTYKIRSFLKGESDENDLGFFGGIDKTFDDFIYKKIKPFVGKSIFELKGSFGEGLRDGNKSFNRLVIQRMLGSKKNKIPEFEKADVTLKVIRIGKNNIPKENVSFPSFKFKEVVEVNKWENSNLYRHLNMRFLFIFFKENSKGIYILDSYKFWTMPKDDIEEAKRVWNITKKIINTGSLVREIKTYKSGKMIIFNNFPGLRDSNVIHVRPHGKNREDSYSLVVADIKTGKTEFTKQCFWLNKVYISKIFID